MHRLIEAHDRWEVAVSGQLISQCCFDYGIVIRSSGDEGQFEVRISGPFVLTETGGERIDMDPQADRVRLAPSLALFGRAVDRITAYKDGRLEIGFADYSSIIVPAKDGYEAWEVVGPGGLRIVSMPGGDLTMWRPDDSN